MKILSRSHPKCRSEVFMSILGAFFCFLLFSYISYYIEHMFINHNRFNVIDYFEIILWLIGGCVILCPIILYFIGEVLWQVKGEEIIQYDADFLCIVNKGRIIGKSKRIPWSNVKDVGLLELSQYERLIVHFSVSGEIEESLQILLYKGRNINCGINLSNEKCEEIIETIREKIDVYKKKKALQYNTPHISDNK